MAILISTADGNLTSVTTAWASIETGTVASQATRSANTNTTTSYVYSSAITDTNLNVLDGVLLYGNRLNTTGTVTIAYSQDNGVTDTRNVTVDAADLPVDPSWIFFKFGSTLTLDGGADNKVGIKASSAANATFYRDGTAGNWTRRLRLTALATAAAGDVLYIVGDHTASGAITTRTITMDSTATTDYGTGTDGAADNGMEIGDAGVLTYGTTASTNYYLKLSGTLNVWGNGTLNIGTTGTPIPRNSTAVLEFDPVADGGMGLIANPGGIVNIQGLSRTSAKNIVSCKLNSDAAANATSLSVDTDTGWLSSDQVVVASTTRTASQTELGALNGNAGASSLTVNSFAGVSGGVLNAHSGTSPTQAEVINITRNVKIRSATSTLMAYVFANTTSTVDIDWAEFYYIGENVSNKRGIEIATTTGSFNMQYSSVHDTEDYGIYLVSSSGSSITISNNVCYNLNSTSTGVSGLLVSSTTGVSTISGNIFLTVTATSSSGNGGVSLGDGDLTFQNNTIVSVVGGASTAGIVFNAGSAWTGTISGNVIHSCSGKGLIFNQSVSVTVSSSTIYRNSSFGIDATSNPETIILDTLTAFGNTTANINISSSGSVSGLWVLKSCTINSDASFTTAAGIDFSVVATVPQCVITNSSFGATSAHTTADIKHTNSSTPVRVTATNTTFASSTEFTAQTGLNDIGYIRSGKHDGSSTTHKSLYKTGTIASDQTTRHTASGYSWAMTPNSAIRKLRLPGPTAYDTFKAAVNASSLVTINVYVQKDGSYNGNAPRLVLVGGVIGGIASDVITSLTVGASTWEQLTVTGTPNEAGAVEFYVDCDGTAGNVYVDDVTITQA